MESSQSRPVEVPPMADMLLFTLMLLLVAAAVRVAVPGRGVPRQLPRLVNMSDEAFRISDDRGHVVAVVPPSPYTVDAHYRRGQVVVRRRGSAEAMSLDDIPVVPGVSYLVTAPVARAAGRPDFLTDADLFTV